MKKSFIVLVAMFFLPIFVMAESIPTERLIQLGINAFKQKTQTVSPTVKSAEYWVEEGDTVMLVMNFQNGGFIVMSADDVAVPVIGYDAEESLNLRDLAPGANYWLKNAAKQIVAAKKQQVLATEKITAQWEQIASGEPVLLRNTSVAPLLLSKWNQSRYYNDLCPADENSPAGYGGHVPCGCVALAMASVIHYHRYPATGQGSHSYHSNYGNHSVNFGQQNYNYNVMPYSLTKANNEVAKLIYHCGIAVDMDYEPDGSGSQTEYTKDALKNYYKYSSDIAHASRSGWGGWWGGGNSGYSDEDWIALLKSDIDEGRPIIYSGYAEDEGGHAFVCDGYDASDYFHFNWGWGGYNNGFFTVANVTNAVGGFSQGQDIVYNIHPPTNVYPAYCQSTTISATAGSLEDGSGTEEYQNNTNCTYVIRPTNGKSVTITLAELDLEEGHDFLKIWDGDPNQGGNLINSYTGNTFNPSSSDYVVAPAVYVTFTTDGAGTAQGWKLRFTAKRYTTCTTTRTYTTQNGTVEDGSGDETYASDADCKWIIAPNNATYVNLFFDQFDFSTEDRIEVYNGNDVETATLLHTFTGSTLPSNLRSNTGVMLIHMLSDNYLERAGFLAHWTSDGEDPVEDTTGIEIFDIQDVEFNVFPNPAQTSIFLDIPSSMQNGVVRICDMNGRVVMNNLVSNLSDKNEIPVGSLSNGIYVITLSNATQILSKKLIINK